MIFLYLSANVHRTLDCPLDIVISFPCGFIKAAMQKFTQKIVGMMKSERLFQSQGGPIILSQVYIELVHASFCHLKSRKMPRLKPQRTASFIISFSIFLIGED